MVKIFPIDINLHTSGLNQVIYNTTLSHIPCEVYILHAPVPEPTPMPQCNFYNYDPCSQVHEKRCF
jgi:hypothetical protein